MLKQYIFFLLLVTYSSILAQQDSLVVVEADEKYFEDQFYFGINYNILLNKPDNINQNNFSYGIMGGFIKDLPINKRRNIGFGLGVGVSFNAIYSDLRANKTDSGIIYQEIPDDVDYKRNRISMNFVEFPVEFRWRSSSADDYRFWRVYTGIKIAYLFTARSKFVPFKEESIAFSNNDIRDLQYGLYFSFGYNTWNFYAQYDLTSIFKENIRTTDGELIKPRIIKAGLIFYIL